MGHFKQRLQPWIDRLAQLLQPEPGEYPVLTCQRDGVCNGCNRYHFHKRSQHALLIFCVQPPLHQSLGDFKCDPSAAKLLVGILASRLIGIDDSQRLRHTVGPGQMVIGNDKIDPKPLGGLHRRESTDAHIHADDEPNARGRGALDHIVAQIVALANAVRDMKVGSASAEFNCGLQNDHRHCAIHVVVAVDEHRLFAFDGRIQPIDCRAHAGHLLRGMQVRNAGEKKAGGGIRVCNSAPNEQTRQRMNGSGLPVAGQRLGTREKIRQVAER